MKRVVALISVLVLVGCSAPKATVSLNTAFLFGESVMLSVSPKGYIGVLWT
jgi:uncharacterized protein YcfL